MAKSRDGKTKTCSRCKINKVLAEFYKQTASVDGHSSYCRICVRETTGAWHRANPERQKVIRSRTRNKRLGLERGEFGQLLKGQQGKCAICFTPLTRRNGTRDHHHDCGKLRGLLCTRCNSAIGALGDNVEGLERALAYLLRHQELCNNEGYDTDKAGEACDECGSLPPDIELPESA